MNHYKKNDKIKCINNRSRKGAAVCRNLGNHIAEGDIIAVCDAGDFYPEYRGNFINKFFKSNKEADIFYSDVLISDATGTPLGKQQATEFKGECKPPISHPTAAYKKKVNKIKYLEGYLDTDLYEFFFINCFRDKLKFGFINDVTCIKKDLSSSGDSRDIKKAKELKTQKYKEFGIDIKAEEV